MYVLKEVFLGEIALLLMIFCRSSNESNTDNSCLLATDICPNEHIHFILYTRDHEPVELTEDTVGTIEFDKTEVLKILIHGIGGKQDDTFNTLMINAYFSQPETYNVITVDYNLIAASLLCYKEAVKNLPIIGKCVARFLNALLDSQEHVSYVHAIGFSLGCQVIGVAANLLKEEDKIINRATALDPALPFFEFRWSYLTPETASIVDVYHTNGGGLGQLLPLGTVDFYANGGILQPGCKDTSIKKSIYCSHQRAYDYYAESIYYRNGRKGFYAMEISTIDQLSLLGGFKINYGNQILAGEYLDPKTTGIYCFITNDKSPYAQGNLTIMQYIVERLDTIKRQ